MLKDIIDYEPQEKNGVIYETISPYIRNLLRDKFPRNYTLQFKHSKKLNVKKTKSRSKSLRKSRGRKSKPRRKVKSPKPKKV
jgi:hypothetical protein